MAQIRWQRDVDEALEEAKRQHKPVLVDFTAAPGWSGCARLEAEVYPDARVAEFIERHFVPDRAHIKEQPTMWHRFGTRWTPTVLVLDPDGKEVRRIEGFLPADELLGQLELALGFEAVNHKRWEDAENWFETAVEQFPETDAAPEAQYWAGVSRYSASHDAGELRKTARAFQQRYADSSWAQRASVWKAV